jgi:hypothetical protein
LEEEAAADGWKLGPGFCVKLVDFEVDDEKGRATGCCALLEFRPSSAEHKRGGWKVSFASTRDGQRVGRINGEFFARRRETAMDMAEDRLDELRMRALMAVSGPHATKGAVTPEEKEGLARCRILAAEAVEEYVARLRDDGIQPGANVEKFLKKVRDLEARAAEFRALAAR